MMMMATGLFTSWATRPAISPTVASFPAFRTAASAFFSMVMSCTISASREVPPSRSWSAAVVTRNVRSPA